MVNLLFSPTAEPDQNVLSLKNKTNVVEVVLFEVNPNYSKETAENALTSLNDVLKMQDGFIKRTTASTEDGKYIDIVYWTDIKSAKRAAEDVLKNEKAAKVFEVIKPASIQMYHFNVFNQFEE